MEKKNSVLETIGIIFMVIFIVPLIIRWFIYGVSVLIDFVSTWINTIKRKRKIKKGMKDGSIVKIDGEYYEVEKN